MISINYINETIVQVMEKQQAVIATPTEILLFSLAGLCVGLFIAFMLWYVGYINERRGEYVKTLNDKEYRKYQEWRRKTF